MKERPDDFRKFRSAVFVPIDGVDFMPYAKMLLSPYNGVRIADRVVVITDGDKLTGEAGKPNPGEDRSTKLYELARQNGAEDVLAVFTNTYSLEPELANAGNEACLKSVYLTLHPQSEQKWQVATSRTGDDRAREIQELFKTTPKGDFAQLLAERIGTCQTFAVPEYIKQAIEALVK